MFNPFTDIFSLFTTIFWIWMLIDCARNPALDRNRKIGWWLFILFTHLFGAVIYFFKYCTEKNPMKAVSYYTSVPATPFQAQPDSMSDMPPAAQPEPYQDYTQGYQGHQKSQSTSTSEQQPEVQVASQYNAEPQYEQTIVSYPEMPQQQQQ